jgi:hypothetical protein
MVTSRRPNAPLRLILLCVAAACHDTTAGPNPTGFVVTVSPSLDTVVAGGLTLQLTATIRDSLGQPVAGPVQWSSLDIATASVDNSGIVTGKASGQARIVAYYGGTVGAATLRVLAPDEVQPALQLVAGGLTDPILAISPPGDTRRLFVVLQGGTIRVVANDTMLPAPFLDVSASALYGGERGLLGLAFHPQYAANGRFYVHFSNRAGDTRIVRYTVSSNPDVADPASAETVLVQAQPFSNHNGGMIAFGPDGYLYIALGDGGSGGDPLNNGQSMNTWLGKILRIDVDGAAPYVVPPSNPFVGQTGALPEIWALGLRNPWRFSFDRSTGDMYIADVGQSAFEEIDVQPASSAGGHNYGWVQMEGNACYMSGCQPSLYTLPVQVYSHADGCSVTGGFVYRGSEVAILTGRYLYADYCSGWVRSFRWSGGAATDHREWTSLAGGFISSFGQDGRGELYVVRHGANGSVRRIVPSLR